MRLSEKAYSIACRAHEGQTDKAGEPYINHPVFVASLVDGEIPKTVAYLHDVIEDTDVTIEELQSEGIPAEALEAIEAMTHRDGEAYFEYIKRVSENPIASMVKKADLTHNMDLSRLPNPTPTDRARVGKYKDAMKLLEVRHEKL